MKSGINKATILGNVGKVPTVETLPNGTQVAKFSIATSERWLDKQGKDQERTEWHRIVVYGKLAEIIGKYVIQGTKLYIEGELHTRKWTNSNGQDQYTTEIVLQGYDCTMQMISGTKAKDSQQSQQQYHQPYQQQQQNEEPPF